MANKITQLVNKDGDNLYPLSGGLLSDSVTTDMLQDNSVTSDKIDWTTMTILSNKLSTAKSVSAQNTFDSWTSLTVPESGKYLIIVSGRMTFSGSGVQTYDSGYLLNSSSGSTATWSKGATNNPDMSNFHRADIGFTTVAALSANDEVYAVVQSAGTYNEVAINATFTIIRVG